MVDVVAGGKGGLGDDDKVDEDGENGEDEDAGGQGEAGDGGLASGMPWSDAQDECVWRARLAATG